MMFWPGHLVCGPQTRLDTRCFVWLTGHHSWQASQVSLALPPSGIMVTSKLWGFGYTAQLHAVLVKSACLSETKHI